MSQDDRWTDASIIVSAEEFDQQTPKHAERYKLPLVSRAGDLWDWHAAGWRIVISTNIGWDPKTKANNMGAGIALQAARRYPDLPVWYGTLCEQHQDAMPVVEREDLGLVFFPVKTLLDPENPERSWDQLASTELIASRLPQLAELGERSDPPIALSVVGAGNGGLEESDVLPLLHDHLPRERFVLVHYNPRRRDPAISIPRAQPE